uniref:Uncharacterized protein n=1 Tax=Arundo donax TaxID=35708 RepID=A0A0A9FXQ8_ARUDO
MRICSFKKQNKNTRLSSNMRIPSKVSN